MTKRGCIGSSKKMRATRLGRQQREPNADQQCDEAGQPMPPGRNVSGHRELMKMRALTLPRAREAGQRAGDRIGPQRASY